MVTILRRTGEKLKKESYVTGSSTVYLFRLTILYYCTSNWMFCAYFPLKVSGEISESADCGFQQWVRLSMLTFSLYTNHKYEKKMQNKAKLWTQVYKLVLFWIRERILYFTVYVPFRKTADILLLVSKCLD